MVSGNFLIAQNPTRIKDAPDPATLWDEVRPFVRRGDGVLVLDDSVLDKPFARHMGLVGYHWSGRHRR